ncbi:CPBP family intramembrane glutamic endopeptidase [Fluviicola sp.]|uniref:CPBP family intramembrane glutamic endopeptidase n=1 Tax=Fluviicola sp. TaxID=1917219 RepID=UPI0031D2A6CE
MMKANKSLRTTLIVGISFLVYYVLFHYFGTIKTILDAYTRQGLTSYIITYLLIGLPIFAGTYLICKRENVFADLGMSGNLFTGIGVSALFTLPLFIGGLLFFDFNTKIETENLIAGTLIAGLMEEWYFRGFFFGMLFRHTRIGFIPAIFFGAVIFAFGHLYQGSGFLELTGIFTVTFLGAVFFAWLFAEWKYNLWVPVFTHTFMNLSWALFDVDATALGGLKSNIFRLLTIFLAVGFTLIYKKRKNQPLEVNRHTLLLKRNEVTGS